MEAFVAFARGRTTQCGTHTAQGLFQRKQLKAAFLQSLLLFPLSLSPSLSPVSHSYSVPPLFFPFLVRTEPRSHNVFINGLREWK